MRTTSLIYSSCMLVLLNASCTKSKLDTVEGKTLAAKDLHKSAGVLPLVPGTDTSKYAAARIFPGLVGPNEPRLANQIVPLDLTYTQVTTADLKISKAPDAWLSTGLYAPAGELITIVVPPNTPGLEVQIGAHTDNLTSADPATRKRDPIIFTKNALVSGTNTARNLYGGQIWIRVANPLGSIVNLTISGAVKSPDFVRDQTTDAQWQTMIANTTVPFFELRGRRLILTLETKRLATYPIASPTALVNKFDDKIYHDMMAWYGWSSTTSNVKNRMPGVPWRIVHDIQPSAGAQHAGYPVVATANNSYFSQAVDINQWTGGNWGSYHEIGHNMQMGGLWSWIDLQEVSNNIFSLKVTNRAGYKHSKIAQMMPAVLAFTSTPNPNNTKLFTSASLDVRFGLFMQLMEKYGYGIITYMSNTARASTLDFSTTAYPNSVIRNQKKLDYFYELISDYTGKNMLPFLNAWGIYPSSAAQTLVASEHPMLIEQVWLYDPS
ncbi:M60 family metallopeptidase [Pedobacter frigoris]|uniref:Peptidase M60 domain-containing protein n=1 Tax=Pedobacter frigoris TaxID=2571272 RepID=A0A4U1CF38_9SPHI|nr:M60 family metallopeptidase [Pedobacter frigoris]TKC05150.1 hypothetical protein FA047_15435 [Pedobacter frigoris]